MIHTHEKEEMIALQNRNFLYEGVFCGEPLTPEDEMRDLADAIYNGDIMDVDADGVIHLGGGANSIPNGTRISGEDFAAEMPTDPDQWYNKNERLFRTEVAVMRQRFPKAGFGFMKSTGNMYWVIEMKVSQTDFAKPWKFMLVYDKNHPHNNTYGGSIKVFPMKPNVDDIRKIAREFNRAGVPHLLKHDSLGTYLCTRRTDDVKDGVQEASSAVTVAAWAADWALHFEVGCRNDKVWNKWCNDTHFYKLKTCFKCGELCKNSEGYQSEYRCSYCTRK